MSEKRYWPRLSRALLSVFGASAFFWKTWGGAYGRAGVADVIGCARGRFVALELKQKRGIISERQQQFLDAVRKAGGIRRVIYTNEDPADVARWVLEQVEGAYVSE